ncbi:uncharacterized protein LOC122506557 isoform X2 [Leptopilina heterotoma]|uniref:uncharacterized protein LOC122506557 isoform X2 n=1 Tax=Leptopilina heterotoma TaxID=63436 RepID=UPI001CA9020D|nr:uncharacterized protein LOC122506557 isoform X2 [Leptopilina heterotoma]
MSDNSAESRIPIPRAVRPSFLPKLRANKLASGHRRSAIISGYPHVNSYENDNTTTPKVKTIKRAASTPAAEGKSDGTYKTSCTWSADNNDDERLERLSNEKLDFLGLVEDPQLKRLDDVEDNNCHQDLNNLGAFGDAGTASAPHYLMLHKQNSFEHDESLGILTPDQMPDFTVALEGSRTPSCENLTGSAGGKLIRHSALRPSEVPLSLDVEPIIAGSIERSPSPEELPLDPKPAEPVRSVLPVSFITSITSITSLEAGYQGDGENSRPASRGPEIPLVVAPSNLIVAPCRQDPMTDSDFFTESDADAHEEIIRGDRRAQVIDGTLFCAPGGRICPSFMGEEMDSSGIYSDLDKRQDDRPNCEEVFSEDRTPDTADTELSQKSQLSPNVKPEPAQIILNYLQDSSKNVLEVSNDSMETSMPMEVTTIEVDRNRNRQIETDDQQTKSNNKNETPPHVKKYKMPKRNVISKIKEMIESGPKDEGKESRRPQRAPRKNGRWDAVMNKIEAGKNEARARVMRKDVKSRVLQNLTNATTSSPGRRNCGDANNNAGSNKDKRRGRGRQETKSPNQETARSSVRSSMSDLSSAPGKEVPKRSPPTNNQTRRQVNGRSNQVSRTNSYEAKKTCLDPPTINLEKSPSATRKVPIVRRAATIIPNKQKSSSSIKDRGPKETASPETREKTAQTDAVINENSSIKRAESTIQALSITVNYLANELDGFSSLRWRRNYEMMKTKWISANENVESLRSRHMAIEQSIEENKEEHRRALERLQENLDIQHAEHIKGLEQAMREERALFESRLQETVRENRATIARLQAEHEIELTRIKEDETDNRRIFVHDQGAVLQAEADSLRTVLELKSKEITGLRSENDFLRRELEGKQMLEQRVESLEAKCEDLKAQLQSKEIYERQISHENEVLLDSYHEASKHNKRLTQRNEELLWRLRQRNEVVNVLANQLATPPQRLSRSLGPEHIDHTITGSKSPQSSSMVKYIVEKGDSISWTVTMDESAERATAPRRNSVSRQSSLRLSMPRGQTTSSMRTRSKSVSVSESNNENNAWTPAFNSTPLRRRPGSVSPSANSESVEETSSGPRPQEAGGEAMISEETSASSSEDESFANGDISRLSMDFWEKSAE